MPILNYHLPEGEYTEEQCKELLEKSSQLYAEVLKCPIDRVRVFIDLYKPNMVAVAGVPVSEGGQSAPYFQFYVLAGRSLSEKHQLLIGFTDLVVEILGAERSLVRGGCGAITPEDWCIGGVPASTLRVKEIEARKAKAG